jgi:DNA repair exonuclease SbcCD ATPase subunit
MMRPAKLQIRNFRGWSAPVEIDLDRPVTLIVGGNQRGKSSTLNAMEWCLFGTEVEKKGSGIAERSDWEAANRESPDEPVEVALTLTAEGGDYRVVRRRHGGTKTDEFFAESPDGKLLDGPSLDEWWHSSGLPNWPTWRRAYCQHQEAARARVLDSGDRSAVLGSLLGLEDDLRLRSTLESRAVFSDLDKKMGEVGDALLTEIERPLREVDELKDRIARKGTPKDAMTPSLPNEIAGELLHRAEDMAAQLQIPDAIAEVDVSNLESVTRWAEGWPGVARSNDGIRSRLSGLRQTRKTLAAALAQAEPLDDEHRQARADLAKEVSNGGDAATRMSALDREIGDAKLIGEQLSAASARRALLKDALRALEEEPEHKCPVCGNPDASLATRLEREISALETTEISRLEEAQQLARKAVEAATAAMTAIKSAESRATRAATNLAEAMPSLRSSLGIGPSEDVDVLAQTRVAIETLGRDVESLEDTLSKRDESLNSFAERADLLRELVKLKEAQRRVDARVDVTALPSWSDLQRAIDASAELVVDREALAAMVREAQVERSKRHADDANAALGTYAEAITGSRGLKIEVNSSPKRVTYEIVDDENRRAMPVLNQAALNALSIALLLAQAEQQAREGRPAWVILDDPIQSLDAEHQRGLAAALDRIARHCPVLVGVTPSDLVDRTEKFVSQRRRIVWLKPGSRDVPLAIDRVEDM